MQRFISLAMMILAGVVNLSYNAQREITVSGNAGSDNVITAPTYSVDNAAALEIVQSGGKTYARAKGIGGTAVVTASGTNSAGQPITGTETVIVSSPPASSIVLTFGPEEPIPAPPSEPLFQQSQLVHQGTFTFPGGGSGGARFDGSYAVMAYNPANNSLIAVGHYGENMLCEVSIPALGGTAGFIQNWTDVTARIPNNPLTDTRLIGGMAVKDGKLIGTLFEFYDADMNVTVSHFKLDSLDLLNANVTGLHNVGDGQAGHVAGYIAEVPSSWLAQVEKGFLSGLCGVPIQGRQSIGPAAWFWNPDELGPATPTLKLLDYTLANPLRESSQNAVWNSVSEVRGAFCPPGHRSILFFGTHGLGTPEYGVGTSDPALAGTPAPGQNTNYVYDPNRSDKGYHAWPYQDTIWAYDRDLLVEVKNGTRQPWDVEPYGVWDLNMPTAEADPRIGSVTWDSAGQKLYVIQRKGRAFDSPEAHVYTLAP